MRPPTFLILFLYLYFYLSAIAGEIADEKVVKFNLSGVTSSNLNHYESSLCVPINAPKELIPKVKAFSTDDTTIIIPEVLSSCAFGTYDDGDSISLESLFTSKPNLEGVCELEVTQTLAPPSSNKRLELLFSSKPGLDDVDRGEITQTLAPFSSKKRIAIINCADQHFPEEMNSDDGPLLIKELAEIRTEWFEERLNWSSQFFTIGMKYGHKLRLIKQFATLPTEEDCNNIRDHLLCFSLQGNANGQAIEFIDVLKAIINLHERNFKVYLAKYVCGAPHCPASYIDIIMQAVRRIKLHRRQSNHEEFYNILQNASLFFLEGSTWENKVEVFNAFSSTKTPFEREYKAAAVQSIITSYTNLTAIQREAYFSDVVNTINAMAVGALPQFGPINADDIHNSAWHASYFFINGSTWHNKLQLFSAIASIQHPAERYYKTMMTRYIYPVSNLSPSADNVISMLRDIAPSSSPLFLSNTADEIAHIQKNASLLFIKGSTWKHKMRVVNALSSIQDPSERDAKTQSVFFTYNHGNTDNFKYGEIGNYFENIIRALNE